MQKLQDQVSKAACWTYHCGTDLILFLLLLLQAAHAVQIFLLTKKGKSGWGVVEIKHHLVGISSEVGNL